MSDYTNPNGANATQSDPREQVAWDNYVESITIGQENAYKAAIDAGYSHDSARNVTTRDWFKERLGKLKRKDMFSKAEKILDRTLSYDPVNDDGKIDVPLVRVQVDAAKHITKTLGKDEGYSERTEHTGKDGSELTVQIINYADNPNPAQVQPKGIPDTNI